jgi:hypothetical protein
LAALDNEQEARIKLNQMFRFQLGFHDRQNLPTKKNQLISNFLFLVKNFVTKTSNRSHNGTQNSAKNREIIIEMIYQ